MKVVPLAADLPGSGPEGRVNGLLGVKAKPARPLTEDDSVRSSASTTLNARASYRFKHRYTLSVDVFNLTDAKASDIDYFYDPRCPARRSASSPGTKCAERSARR